MISNGYFIFNCHKSVFILNWQIRGTTTTMNRKEAAYSEYKSADKRQRMQVDALKKSPLMIETQLSGQDAHKKGGYCQTSRAKKRRKGSLENNENNKSPMSKGMISVYDNVKKCDSPVKAMPWEAAVGKPCNSFSFDENFRLDSDYSN